jgi:hypothetical protein
MPNRLGKPHVTPPPSATSPGRCTEGSLPLGWPPFVHALCDNTRLRSRHTHTHARRIVHTGHEHSLHFDPGTQRMPLRGDAGALHSWPPVACTNAQARTLHSPASNSFPHRVASSCTALAPAAAAGFRGAPVPSSAATQHANKTGTVPHPLSRHSTPKKLCTAPHPLTRHRTAHVLHTTRSNAAAVAHTGPADDRPHLQHHTDTHPFRTRNLQRVVSLSPLSFPTQLHTCTPTWLG